VNKTEGPKIVPMKQSEGLRLQWQRTEQYTNRKNSFPSTAHESQFRDKQKFHSAPKQKHQISTEVLSNWPFIMWLQRMASSA